MKRTLQILTLLVVVLSIFGLGYTTSQTNESSYSPRENVHSATQWAGALEHRRQMLANPETGEIDNSMISRVEAAFAKLDKTAGSRNLDLGWISAGPDNVGGRTRAICTFTENPSTVIIGSVSGGLFKSTNSGVNWTAIPGFNSNVAVSAIARTGNGKIFVGTGHRYDSFNGDGLYVSEDNGTSWNTVQNFKPSQALSSSSDWSQVTALKADPVNPAKVWICYGGGVATYTWGDADVEVKLGPVYASSIDISNDGQTIIAVKGNEVHVSTDGGNTFVDRQSSNFGDIPSGATGRIEVALSHENPDYMYVLIANTSGYLRGVFASTDRGASWYEIAPDSNNGTNPFSPFLSVAGQGVYDNACTVVPGHPDRLIIGGVRMYRFQLASPIPPLSGTWSNINVQFANGPNPYYVHSDIHTFHWDVNNVFYVGCDGGIFKSFNSGTTYVPSNYNYRSTQYYGIATNVLGHIAGGTQDNGTHLITGMFSSPNDAESIRGGDGFDTEMSQYNPNLIFGTIYNNDVARSLDGGELFIDIIDQDAFPGPFNTTIGLYERIDETMATESYYFYAQQDYTAGQTIDYTSQSYGIPLSYTLTEDLLEDSLIRLPDPAQSLFAVGGIGRFWLTRDATKEEVSAGDIDYGEVSQVPGSAVITCFAFSPDGDICYAGSNNGSVYRVSGLRSAYSGAEIQSAAASSFTTIYQGGGYISDIAVDYNNPNRLALSKSGYGSAAKIYISDVASSTTANNTFQAAWNIPGDLALMPAYSVLFDKNNPSRILAGTEYGVWVSDDLGISWEEASVGMGRVPVYALRQQNTTNEQLDGLPFNIEVLNPGGIYAGTFGKGLYYIGDFILGVDDIQTTLSDKPFFDLTIFPNPTTDAAKVKLNLTKTASVTLEIMDMSGRLVYRDMVGKLAAGERVISIPVNQFENGNYILNVITENYNETGRFVVLK
jgi:hypothetical protein